MRPRSDRHLIGTRRTFLAQASALTGIGIAGCMGDDTDDADDGTEPDDTDPEPDDENETDDEFEPHLPTTGQEVPALAAVEEATLRYMESLELTAGALGISKNGEIVLERGYGWLDEDHTTETPTDAQFRIASISKTLTNAGIRHLAAENKIDLEDSALDYLDIDTLTVEPADERFDDITIEMILEHTAGFIPAGTAADPVFDVHSIVETYELTDPPTMEDMVRYIVEQPLQDDPGEETAYSNAGHVLLGRIIETVSGQRYQDFISSEISPPTVDIAIARTDPEERPENEVYYQSTESVPSALDPNSTEEVPIADGGFLLEPMAPAGGHISSTASLLEFMEQYWIYTGEERTTEDREMLAIGSLPGTYAVAQQRPDSISFVALFNGRKDGVSREIIADINYALDAVEDWPV